MTLAMTVVVTAISGIAEMFIRFPVDVHAIFFPFYGTVPIDRMMRYIAMPPADIALSAMVSAILTVLYTMLFEVVIRVRGIDHYFITTV